MNGQCPRCKKRMKEFYPKILGSKNLLRINFCPKCEYYESHMPLIPLIAFKGTALGDPIGTTGQFMVRVDRSKEDLLRKGAEIRVKIFPALFLSKEVPVYSDVNEGDEVIVAGLASSSKYLPLVSIILKNLTNGATSIFVDEQIELKKGIFSSFNIRNPILVQAEKRIDEIMGS